jgi:hypothetical protein
MAKHKRVSRPHPTPPPRRRLVTKARQQELDEEARNARPEPGLLPPVAPKKAPAGRSNAPIKSTVDTSATLSSSPDLLALTRRRP